MASSVDGNMEARADEATQDVLGALSTIRAPGSFASLGVLPKVPPAGLFVRGVGDISMPLRESQAQQLIAKARQAPFGKRGDTIVDTAVRNTWELDPDQFTFRHSGWPLFLRDLCRDVAENLGINAAIRAELYKMLIYEKGAMFKAHTDTEKMPGMFGTLVICLPSAHQGGEVVLKHGGQQKVLKTSEAAQSFVCWYSDVSHEVLPVTSGYRWVLTYNLALSSAETAPPSAGLQQASVLALRQAFGRWLAQDEDSSRTECLYHVLDHRYTEANLSLKALKTHDLAQVQALEHVSDQLPVDIFLAFLEKMEMGGCSEEPYPHPWYNDMDYTIEDLLETSYQAKTLVDLKGRVVTKNLPLPDDDSLLDDCFANLEADEKECDGYTGNEGMTATHWYRIAAVIIVRRDSVGSLFSPRGLDVRQPHHTRAPIRYYASACLEPQAPQTLTTALVNLCEAAWKDEPRPEVHWSLRRPEAPFDAQGIRDVLRAAVQQGRYDFFEKAAARHRGLLPAAFFVWLRQWLGADFGGDAGHFNEIQKGTSSAVLAYPHLADQVRAVTTFAPLPKSKMAGDYVSIPERVLDWARKTLRLCLEAGRCTQFANQDGRAVVDLALYFDDPSAFLSQFMTPVAGGKLSNAAFLLGFVAELRDRITEGVGPLQESMVLCRTVAKAFIDLTDFTQIRGETQDQVTPHGQPNFSEQPQRVEDRTSINPEALADFFSTIIEISTEAEDLVALSVSRIVQDAPRLPASEFHSLWLPFLRSLLAILHARGVPLATPCYRLLCTALLKAYPTICLGHKPRKDDNLVRPRVSCDCQDCARLNAFLTAPAQRQGRFSMAEQRRKHLASQLLSASIDCTQVTERVGSPHTLVVTKTWQRNEKDRRDWDLRRRQAEAQISQFNQRDLDLLLEPSRSAIVSMERFLLPPSAPGPATGLSAGVKRKPAPGED
ncbi:2OG-Fe(II) oxygenase superfamily domain-containing protein [Hirsutella rhossiliensis]|uniref:2OG-Fe(II) oxygenase superfamily domain-containing protein n=1 Tax=Hirsutella rhossiliensis TaxID=111463 RepID=A0A9P8N5G4_9HYPO|nr:2OG-Fe(II) oxygenase superfamily domain-containing protein [Hirsutella rhossiliensis]KAH0966296.1 2OG-Fe(II) oxygenase superfamily domain-containing protein [Hirsutella rhossiliensis]